MDIKCLKCGTEYELDDSRIPPTGLTVKCTTCGFIFKATRPVEAPRKTMMLYGSTPPEPRVTWQIRKPDGTQFGFNDLTALRRLIQEGKVVESDEISRQGEGWRRISDIPEFAGFFIARAVSASPMVSPFPAAPPGLGQVAGPRAAHPESQAPVRTPEQEQSVAASPEPGQEPEKLPMEPQPAEPVPQEIAAVEDEKVTVVSQIPAQLSAEDGRLQDLKEFVAQPEVAKASEEKKVEVPEKEPRGAAVSEPPKAEPAGVVLGKIELAKKGAPAEHDQKESSKREGVAANERPKSARPHPAPTHADLDDTDIYGRPKRGRKALWIVLVVVIVLAAAAAFGLKTFKPELFEELIGGKKALTAAESADLEAARNGIDSGDDPELKKSAVILERLAAGGKLGTEDRARQALCSLLLGQILRDEAADLQHKIEEAQDKSAPGPQTRKFIEDMGAKSEEATANIEKALGNIKELMKNAPDNASVKLMQAYYYVVQSAGDAAIIAKADPLIEEAGKAKADPSVLNIVKGARLLAADPNSSEGLGYIKGLIPSAPKNIYLHYILARAMIAAKRPLAAKDEVEAALAKSPGNTVMKRLLADIQLRMKPVEKKAETPVAAVVVQDGGITSTTDGAAIPDGATQDQEAARDGGQASESQPGTQKNPEMKQVPEGAVPDKGVVTGQGPGTKPVAAGGFESALQMGRRLQKTGRAKQAVDFFQKAAELEPERAEPHTGLGWCNVELEKFDQAIAEFQKALALKGPRCETLSGLGETYRYRKVKQEAIKYYQMYLQECPNGPDAPVARNNLNNLR
jgi:predicted Zn finger-like uncharacterized protein